MKSFKPRSLHIPQGSNTENNPNKRRNALNAAISQRRVGRIQKPKLLNEQTQNPTELQEGAPAPSDVSSGYDAED